ncbi:MAG: hypothetical protein HRT87_07015 [Legionellales bacterium]|nr:hypothetical protein [Legionellales bacterium]
MTLRSKITHNPQKYTNFSWALLVITAVVLIISVDLLMQAFSQERFVLSREAEFIELGNKLTKSIEFLSKQARRYVVTQDKSDYKKYFDEIKVKKSRENVIERLQTLNASPKEIQMLLEAKQLSDQISKTEKLSMQLAIPPQDPLKEPNVIIPNQYMNKDNSQKINIARELIFNKKYEDQKQEILVKILEYQKLMTERMTQEAFTASKYTSVVMLVVIILSTLIILLVIILIWLKIILKKTK